MRKEFLIIRERANHRARHMIRTDRVKCCAERVQIVRIVIEHRNLHSIYASFFIKYFMKIRKGLQV